MKLSRWVTCLATDAAILGGLYLWQTRGFEGARNVVLVVGWVQAVLGVIGGFAAKKGDLPSVRGSFRAYVFISCSATVVALAWCGLVALSITYLIGWLLIEASRMPSRGAA